MRAVPTFTGLPVVCCLAGIGRSSADQRETASPIDLAPLDADSTYVAELRRQDPGRAILTFNLPGWFVGVALDTSVDIDGAEVSDRDNGTYIVVAGMGPGVPSARSPARCAT